MRGMTEDAESAEDAGDLPFEGSVPAPDACEAPRKVRAAVRRRGRDLRGRRPRERKAFLLQTGRVRLLRRVGMSDRSLAVLKGG